MRKTIAASASVLSLLLILASVPQALANGADREDKGKTFVVKSPDGEYLGTARKVLLNPLGKADFVVVSLGEGESGTKQILVPYDAVSVEGDDAIILKLDKDALAGVPEYTRSELQDAPYFEEVYRFYGMTPPWTEGK